MLLYNFISSTEVLKILINWVFNLVLIRDRLFTLHNSEGIINIVSYRIMFSKFSKYSIVITSITCSK